MARLLPPIKTGLNFEEASSDKHEFVKGQIFMMAGSTEKHNRISLTIASRLLAASESTPCRVLMVDVKVRTPNDVGYYPDVLVTCDDFEVENPIAPCTARFKDFRPRTDDHPVVKRKPCLIVEVLSDSTEAIDRGEKLGNYRLIQNLQAYVLVNQMIKRIEVYRRHEDGSWRYEVYEAGEILKLPCVGLELVVDSLYQGL
jgi:Uma2 family endonuclease